jgi:hypothetical protein
MGHRDLLVTHNLSEHRNHTCRPRTRGSVRRASGFVLTGKQEATDYFLLADIAQRDFAKRFERGKLSFTGDVLQV